MTDVRDVVFFGAPLANVNAAVREHFRNPVDKIVIQCGEYLQCSFEKLDLVFTQVIGLLWDEDDQSRMNIEPGVLLQKIPAVQGHDDIIMSDSEGTRFQSCHPPLPMNGT